MDKDLHDVPVVCRSSLSGRPRLWSTRRPDRTDVVEKRLLELSILERFPVDLTIPSDRKPL